MVKEEIIYDNDGNEKYRQIVQDDGGELNCPVYLLTKHLSGGRVGETSCTNRCVSYTANCPFKPKLTPPGGVSPSLG